MRRSALVLLAAAVTACAAPAAAPAPARTAAPTPTLAPAAAVMAALDATAAKGTYHTENKGSFSISDGSLKISIEFTGSQDVQAPDRTRRILRLNAMGMGTSTQETITIGKAAWERTDGGTWRRETEESTVSAFPLDNFRDIVRSGRVEPAKVTPLGDTLRRYTVVVDASAARTLAKVQKAEDLLTDPDFISMEGQLDIAVDPQTSLIREMRTSLVIKSVGGSVAIELTDAYSAWGAPVAPPIEPPK